MSDYTTSWWYKIITFSAIVTRIDNAVEFFKGLVNQQNPLSSHEAVNMVWGLGSFILYWLDHFVYHRVFSNQDFLFLATMSGITAIAAVTSSNNAGAPPVAPKVPPVVPGALSPPATPSQPTSAPLASVTATSTMVPVHKAPESDLLP